MALLRRRYAGISRAVTVAVGVILQVLTMYFLVRVLREYSSWVYILLEIFSILLVFMLVNDSESYKFFWVIIVLILPVFGFFLYFMWGRKRTNSKMNRRIREIEEKGKVYKIQDPEIIDEFKKLHPNKVQICRQLVNYGFPVYKNTNVIYYESGEKQFEAMFVDMESAKSFIFLEYFIIYEGEIWSKTKEILGRKVREGVEVRLLYDDFGCLITNTNEFRHELAQLGIRFSVFAPIQEEMSRLTFNYRNHQKIVIIDGNIGYTGGINIGDEYANLYEKFGYWKDTAVRLTGEGTWGLTSIFLEMWEISKGYEDLDYNKYKPTLQIDAGGYVQAMADGPANNPENPIESTYTHMINKTRDYIYFTTPYLVLDNKMMEDLRRAAKSGVDVRIITPRRYDKWYVYMVTVMNYGKLLEAGVKIYEYVPGFIHSKIVVSDDDCAICGSINMDYRSFYLHYECGVFMSENDCVFDIKQDFMETLKKCERISYDKWKNRGILQKAIQWTLKIFSPIL